MIDTRSIHRWLLNNTSKIRILVMHHPIDWLAPWAKIELDKIINDSFKLAYFGHIHEGQSVQYIKDGGNCICLTAPALFTKKSEQLGYSITRLDTATGKVEIEYRQFARNNQFVLGTLLAGNDAGKRVYDTLPKERHIHPSQSHAQVDLTTLTILRREFDNSIKCYSNKAGFWIERDLSKTPESEFKATTPPELTASQLASSPKSCIIRAPSEFGLSSLGYYLALNHFESCNGNKILLRLDCEEPMRGPKEIALAVEKRCAELKINAEFIHGFILDNWMTDKIGKKTLALLKDAYPSALLIALCGVDDCAQVSDYIEKSEKDPTEGLDVVYLWALDRSKVRLLVEQYTINANHLDSDRVTKKIISDLDSLNTHRSPLNCLLLLRLYEQAFDDSPVNRTEMISRVLNLLFFQFDAIPSYASRPDLKDCEFVLGCFCEKLIRGNRKTFTKQEFNKLDSNCLENHIDLEIHILFAFLHTENIIIQKGNEFEFRFNYWLYYFAAHRMHHDPDFRQFMLSHNRYSAYPEILEFYAGITRRCQDAVDILIKDLKTMAAEFVARTGIPDTFNPLTSFSWHPSENALASLKREVTEDESMAAVPAVVRDAVADSTYSRNKPYNQDLAKFITESSLTQMMSAVKGAARTLRNSDYVTAPSKIGLLNEVINCWCKVAQLLITLSPALANSKEAHFEGINFMLDHTFDHLDTVEKRWHALMNAVASNVANWYQEDIFSKKMGPLLLNYVRENKGTLGELLALYVIVKQKPSGWEGEIEQFIVRENKNSFYLNRVFSLLINDCKYGYNSERHRQQSRRLSAMALAKHDTGSKHPNQTLVEKVAKQIIDGKVPNLNKIFFKKTFG